MGHFLLEWTLRIHWIQNWLAFPLDELCYSGKTPLKKQIKSNNWLCFKLLYILTFNMPIVSKNENFQSFFFFKEIVFTKSILHAFLENTNDIHIQPCLFLPFSHLKIKYLTLFPWNFLHLWTSFSGNRLWSKRGSVSELIPWQELTVTKSMRSLSGEWHSSSRW